MGEIDAVERVRRRRRVDEVRASWALEGAQCSEQVVALQERYVAGDITADELVARVRALHGLT